MLIQRKRLAFLLYLLAAALMLPFVIQASFGTQTVQHPKATGAIDTTLLESQLPKASHRLIVELESAPLALYASASRTASNRLDVNSASSQAYVAQIEAEQGEFITAMSRSIPEANVASYFNENGIPTAATYQITFNGVAVDMGKSVDFEQAREALLALPHVKAVYRDYAHEPTTYASLPLINAPAIYSQVGGSENAGAGVKFATMDGGAHHEAAMFDGTGFNYPAGWPSGGLGDSANNNGKIIASRAYFRDWDPPAVGDENTWPGTNGTSHGTHTASTAAGIEVVADYLGITQTVSGVAPAAWIMSYRVFYNSVTNDGSFYNVEGIAALEDIVADGADVVNNSWGGGPGSNGSEGDPLNIALLNTYYAGVFVSMSAGNAGPGLGTGDHPSDEYINVAASTTTGTFSSGRLFVTAPEPISPTLQGMPIGTASFGEQLPIAEVVTRTFKTALSVNPANVEGCNAWPADTFAGTAAIISRGACEFGVKALNAEQAGATMVVLYNTAANGNVSFGMAPGAVGNQVTIPVISVGHSNGLAMNDWYAQHGAASVLEVNTQAFQAGNTPDVIANFSSRGPSAAGTLKPDIAAPGVNILAQGYGATTGEARHLGFGQVSGTSMASPHVAGAATILRQMYPSWTNAQIKSALMSTSKYMDIYNADGSPAQPLDMGAGRLDLTNAADPGVILSPPSLSFGEVLTGTDPITLTMYMTNITTQTETYSMTTLYTGAGFTSTTTLDGFTVSPSSITLAAGETGMVMVSFDSAASQGIGDNQGYIIMSGEVHEAHAPAWARVLAPASADVLIIKNDGESSVGFDSYLSYYTEALDQLGMTYDVWDADANFANPTTILDAAYLNDYKAIIYYTGDNYYPDGSFTVSTTPTVLDMDILNEYANSGGVLIAMGQDLAAVMDSTDPDNASFLYGVTLGGEFLQDNVVTGGPPALPTLPIVPHANAPTVLNGLSLDLSGPVVTEVGLSGAKEVPAVATANSGTASFWLDGANGELYYDVTLTANTPFSLTASHIHTGTADVSGGVAFNLAPVTQTTYITDSFSFNGSISLSEAEMLTALADGYYINVHTTDNPTGELRGQVEVTISGDGAANQYYVDEIAAVPNYSPNPVVGDYYPYQPLLVYPGTNNEDEGVVAMSNRDQPTLEYPAVSFDGKAIYTTFGLEGVNNGVGSVSRWQLLGAMFAWAMDEPTATISDTTGAYTETGQQVILTANMTDGASFRWDFGDGSEYTVAYTSDTIGHTYDTCGTYTVRVEATNTWGNKVIGTQEIEVTQNCSFKSYVPFVTMQ